MTRHVLALGLCLVLTSCNESTIEGNCPPEDPACGLPGGGDGGIIDPNAGKPEKVIRIGPGGDMPFDPKGEGSSGVKLDENGNIVLDPGNVTGNKLIIWVANSAEGTVSKVDTRTLKELARYDTFRGAKADPSRTTVSLSGDVVVANRAWQNLAGAARSSALKIAGELSGCVDRNNNKKIDTHVGAGPVPAAFKWQAGQMNSPDECVLWLTDLGPAGETVRPRAAGFDATIGPDGTPSSQVYIGLHDSSEVVRLDAKTGAILKRISVAPAKPYGLVIDRDTNVWVRGSEDGGSLAKIDVRMGDKVTVYNGAKKPPCSYGIAADAQGRIYTAGSTCLGRFTPSTETWERLDIPGATLLRGLAVDQNNGVWIADTQKGMFHVDASGDDMQVKGMVSIAPDAGAAHGNIVGAAIDFDNIPWLISLNNSKAYKVTADYTAQPVAVGLNPYTYSDMTGFQLRNAGAPVGTYRHTFMGCGTDTRWVNLDWKITAPPGTQAIIRVRTAQSPDALMGVPWTQVATVPPDQPPVTLKLPGGNRPDYLQVEINLRTGDPMVTPVLSDLRAGFNCIILG